MLAWAMNISKDNSYSYEVCYSKLIFYTQEHS